MDRFTLPTVLVLLAAPMSVLAQDDPWPTPEEFAARAEEAAAAPLFQSHDILHMTLRTDIQTLRARRDTVEEVQGTVTFVDLNGTESTRPVQVRARGNFRRDPRNCNFPPLRLNFPRGDMDGTVFEGQDRLKLVTPCQDSRAEYQRYIYDEYLAYRVANILTPYSYRVRLVEITYEDTSGDYETRTKHGFLIEADEEMAARNRAIYLDVPQMHPMLADGDQSVLTGMFNYMIGNLDWSAVYFHNAVVIRVEDGRHLTVPYDFDFAGAINARYAVVPPQLQDQVRRVRQRLYREFCRPELTLENVRAMFADKRGQVEELYRTFPYYAEPDQAEDAIEYYEDFWDVVTNQREFENEILEKCTPMPR
ncbi:MAG: hypothetical protein AB7T31_09720 [Gemmatimonadales bacterium]